MLVTVGIMAAVAGTATLALQDTTARASAAAHVAMMDELNEGVRVFRAMPSNASFPNNFDSLLEVAATPVAATPVAGTLFSQLGIADIAPVALNTSVKEALEEVGITSLKYVDTSLAAGAGAPEDSAGLDCTDAAALISGRTNAVVAGNIYLSPAANGCGAARTLEDTDTVAIWTGGTERVTGFPLDAGVVDFDGTNAAAATGPAYMAVGFGPSSNLFDTSLVGGMTSVPVYRHVANNEYNRFIGLFYVGDFDGAGAITRPEQVQLITVVDGAGDTKEEELGEWDGTRNTI